MKIKQLPIKEYADIRQISRQAVFNAIKFGWKLPCVESVKKIGRQHVLEVNMRALNRYMQKARKTTPNE